MRCSSCELLLDRYVEGTLSPHQMLRMSEHVKRCTACAGLLTELRVVDALLATTAPVELAPNFTFAVMAEVRGTSIARNRSRSAWSMLAFYLIAAWIAISAGVAFFGHRIAAIGAGAEAFRGSLSHGFDAIAGTAHALGPATPAVVGIVTVVLALDIVLALAIVLYYSSIRPRLSASLARSEGS